MKTQKVKLSDNQIKQHGPTDVQQLVDSRTGLIFRYFRNRSKGAFHVRHYTQGRDLWRKVANWPDTPAHLVLSRLSDIRVSLSADTQASRLQVQGWETVNELLTWYLARVTTHRHLSAHRKANVKSVISRHLVPSLGALPVTSFTKVQLDEHLIWPLQADYCLAYVQSIFKILKAAYKQAYRLERIEHNPMAQWVFGDFITAPVPPKPGVLRQQDGPVLMRALSGELYPPKMLCVWMALHATRITETRQMRWQWVDWANRRVTIPGQYTKNKLPHTYPLTPVAELVLRTYQLSQQAQHKSQVYLFPGQSRRAISHTTANAWVNTVSEERWSAHDLRKFARSLWSHQGVEHWLGERLLNHAQQGLDAVYNQAQVDARMYDALNAYHAFFYAHDFYVSAPRPYRDQMKTIVMATPRVTSRTVGSS